MRVAALVVVTSVEMASVAAIGVRFMMIPLCVCAKVLVLWCFERESHDLRPIVFVNR